MSVSSSPFHTSQADSGREGYDRCLDLCLERTLKAFHTSGAADEEELRRLQLRYRESREAGRPADLVELLARTKGTEEEHMGQEVARLGHAISTVISPSPPLIPFAGKLIAPSAFYEAYSNLHELSRALMAPIIYAEDTDAIGTGALNPIAALIMSEEILSSVSRRFAIQPFVTPIRIDYESWTFLTRKHFEL